MQFAKSAARRVPASGQVLEEKSQSRSDEEETGDGESGEKLSAETVPEAAALWTSCSARCRALEKFAGSAPASPAWRVTTGRLGSLALIDSFIHRMT